MKEFDCNLDYARLDLRRRPDLYRIGRGEQGVLLVEPYKSEIFDSEKAAAAEIFRRQWERVRNDPAYVAAHASHRRRFESTVARKLQPQSNKNAGRKSTSGNASRAR